MTEERAARENIRRQRPLNETERPSRRSYYNVGNVAPNIVDLGLSLIDARMKVVGTLFDVIGNTLNNAGQRRTVEDESRYEDDLYDGDRSEAPRRPGRANDRGQQVATAMGDGIQQATRIVDEIGAAATRNSPRTTASQQTQREQPTAGKSADG